MKTRRKNSSSVDHFKSYTPTPRVYEVWVLGTWIPGTGEATVVFEGTMEAAVEYRANSDKRSTLAIRPTDRNL